MTLTDALNPRFSFTVARNLFTATSDNKLHRRPDSVIATELTEQEKTRLAQVARHYAATGSVIDFSAPSLEVTRNGDYMALYFSSESPIGIMRIDIDRAVAEELANA